MSRATTYGLVLAVAATATACATTSFHSTWKAPGAGPLNFKGRKVAALVVEATTLSLSGGVIGILLGTGVALVVGALSPLPAAVSLPAVVMGIAMSSVIGIFFGSYPAFRAARLDPIEALRYE